MEYKYNKTVEATFRDLSKKKKSFLKEPIGCQLPLAFCEYVQYSVLALVLKGVNYHRGTQSHFINCNTF